MPNAMTETAEGPLVEADALELAVGGRVLLRSAQFTIRRGEMVALVGVSGTGKTLLGKLLSGVLHPRRGGIHVRGTLRFAGWDLTQRPPPPGRVGILFQNHALFDELDARENVLFALRHRRRRPNHAPQRAQELLESFGVPPRARPRTMSGGELQRLALARTLALEPELLVFDEPTTGLDPGNARRVGERIRDLHHKRGTTSLVITHDTEFVAPLADRVLLLDPTEKAIVEVSGEQTRERLLALGDDESEFTRAPLPPAGLLRPWLERTCDVLTAALWAIVHLVPAWPRLRYGLRYSLHYLRLSLSIGALAYLALAGAILGFVTTWFTFEHLPRRDWTEPLFIDEVLRALGYLLYRVLCPVLLTILVAARMGAAITADVGGKVYARQFDALRSFAVAPSRYLLTGILWSVLLSVPLLFALHFLCARTASHAVFLFGHQDHSSFFWDRAFHRSLRLDDSPLWRGTWWTLVKLELCALGIGAIAYFQGAREKQAADDVSRAVRRTIIGASVFVLLVHFGTSFFEF